VQAFCSRRVHHRDRHQHTIRVRDLLSVEAVIVALLLAFVPYAGGAAVNLRTKSGEHQWTPIFCGVLTLIVSIWEFHWTLRYLWGGGFAAIAGMTKEAKQTPLYAVAIALILVGVFAFSAVLLRLV
jgi:xanthine/uracil permease